MFKTTGIYKTNESQLDNHYEESGKTKQNQTLYISILPLQVKALQRTIKINTCIISRRKSVINRMEAFVINKM